MQRFEIGRHIRMNTPNITKIEGGEGEEDQWYYGEPIRGEGMYECFGGGTHSPGRLHVRRLRRLRLPDAALPSLALTNRLRRVSNGGVCKEKDTCECVTGALSVLHCKYPECAGRSDGLSRARTARC